MSFEDWELRTLEEVADVVDSLHQTPEYSQVGYPMVRVTDIKGGFLQLSNTLKVNESTFKKFTKNYMPRKGDIIFSRVGTYGISSLVHDEWVFCLGQNTAAIIPKINSRFLYYCLNFDDIKIQIEQLAVGSTQKTISLKSIRSIKIPTPNLPTQQRIAAILSAFDDKIALNRQMNQTLEEMARAVFREWFVNFNYPGADGLLEDGLPLGWRLGTLGEVCEAVRSSVQPKDMETGTPYVGLEHIPRKSLTLTEWGTSEDVDSQKARFRKGDILFGKLRPYFHKVAIAPTDGICSTDILVFRPLVQSHYAFVLNHLFSESLISYVSGIADGTRMPRVDWRSVANYQIVIPPDDLLVEFNRIVRPFYTKLVNSIFETQNLATLRDSLLPKLMRGEISVHSLPETLNLLAHA